MSYQWHDVLPGDPPDSLKDLLCDCWIPKESPPGEWSLLVLWCDHFGSGWYRPLPVEDVPAAKRLWDAIGDRQARDEE